MQAYADAAKLFYQQNDFEMAIACTRAGLDFEPGNPVLTINLALIYKLQDATGAASALLRALCANEPRNFIAALALASVCLPSCYRSLQEMEAVRAEYARRLQELPRVLDAIASGSLPNTPFALAMLGNFKPFELPYQGFCDRALQASLGSCLVRYASLVAPVREPTRRHDAGRIRVGFVCEFMRTHSMTKLFRGWMERLNRERFMVHAYAIDPERADAATPGLLEAIEVTRTAPAPGASWEDAILADELDMLIYPEIGMGQGSYVLSTRRLAPIQCVAWGHPETTGLPTMDYFLSSDLMEPHDAADHYTERLIRLPQLSIWYEPRQQGLSEGINREQLGLRKDAFVYACTQSTFKYLPQFDSVFPRIAAQVPQAQFLFLVHPRSTTGTRVFKERLSVAFAALGLDTDRHCIFAPRLDQDAYQAMQQQVDAFLDSIGWSGGVTTLEALDADLPVVTLPLQLMRSRHSAAFLTRLDLSCCIAQTVEEYIALAIRLGTDAAFYQQVRRQINDRKELLYRDAQAIHGLEDFIATAVGTLKADRDAF